MGKIAIVDDDHVQRELLSMVLAAEGHTTHSFSDCVRFLQAAAVEVFDVVLLDWSLPDVGGKGVLQALHEGGNLRTSVIVLSGRSEADVREQALAGGAAAFMLKPARMAQVVRQVAELI